MEPLMMIRPPLCAMYLKASREHRNEAVRFALTVLCMSCIRNEVFSPSNSAAHIPISQAQFRKRHRRSTSASVTEDQVHTSKHLPRHRKESIYHKVLICDVAYHCYNSGIRMGSVNEPRCLLQLLLPSGRDRDGPAGSS